MTPDADTLRTMADAIRALSMDAVEAARSGHPGMPMGMADTAAVLWAHHLKYDAADPAWPDRDRFVLSAGHGSMLLYALLHLTGGAVSMDDIRAFRQLGSKTPGHPEFGETPGVETTTGPLGQGLANAVGMAIAEEKLAAEFGCELVNHRTWVIAGDGCLMEGISQEAIALAGHLRLSKLIVLWDDNAVSIDGPVDLSDTTDQRARFAASGWDTFAVDGHDHEAVHAALAEAAASDRPAMVAVKTTIGFGAPEKAGKAASHGAPLGADEIDGVRQAIGWPHPPFHVPDEVLTPWRDAGARGAAEREAWESRLANSPHADAFASRLSAPVTADAANALTAHARSMAADAPALATRAASGKALEAVGPACPALLGGSADLTGSNNTKRKSDVLFTAEERTGSYIHYGVREHAMAAAMNGMALHGGIVPFAGTFLCFADYARPAIRLAALMGIRVIHVMTHDSIGLGEDGPTHQPVEHLASLRAMPNVTVYRPADAVETAECWALALARSDGPSVLALTRQKVPAVRRDADANRSAAGAYELAAADGGPARVSLFATGSEVSIALTARETLQADGVPTRVVSAPSLDVFGVQSVAARQAVIGDAPVRVAVEAGVRQGWESVLRPDDGFVGMTGFGASAPSPALFEHFGVTPDAVVREARARLTATATA